jgi:MFS family permease
MAVLAVSFSANIFLWPAYQSFMPIFAKDNLGQGPQGLGFLLTSFGAGALVGALVIASLGDFRWRGQLYIYGTVLMTVFFGVFAMLRSFAPAIILVGLAGLASAAFATMQATLTLGLAPEEMRGRCMGFLQMAIGVYTFGSLAIGAVANVVGASLATGISCGILLLTLIAFFITMPHLRRL